MINLKVTYKVKSLLGLFDVTRDELDRIPEKHRKRLSRKKEYLFDASVVPVISPPELGSKVHKNDLLEVKNCYLNPSLQTGFLESSANSVEDVFKEYCKTNGLKLDWKLISKIVEDVDSIILSMKYKHMRPRPRVFLCDQSHAFDSIYESKSPSFPSGHTAIAYFLAGLISNYYPNDRPDLEILAALIGKSRIDNGVHYPTDVSYGRLTGETLCDTFLNKNNVDTIEKSYNKKNDKKFAKFIKNRAKELYSEQDNAQKCMRDAIANFLHRTNEIEYYDVDYHDCLHAAEMMMQGLPSKRISKNKHILAQCNLIKRAYFLGDINSPYKIINLHKAFSQNVLESGTPGEFRVGPHSSPIGHQYCAPDKLFQALRKLENISDAYIKHIVYEWIHPFCDGNGRSGRIILLADLNYDFDEILKFIENDNYIPTLQSFMSKNDVSNMIFK